MGGGGGRDLRFLVCRLHTYGYSLIVSSHLPVRPFPHHGCRVHFKLTQDVLIFFSFFSSFKSNPNTFEADLLKNAPAVSRACPSKKIFQKSLASANVEAKQKDRHKVCTSGADHQ